MRNSIIGLTMVTLLAACGSDAPEPSGDAAPEESVAVPAADQTTDEPAEVAADARPAAVAQCVACHTFEKGGTDGIGPNLWNVHGNPAAQNPEYAYSAALRDAGMTWDDATLDAYLLSPRQSVPGGKMSFGGVRDEAKRAEIVAWLATQKD